MKNRIAKICDQVIWVGLLILVVGIPPLISLKMEDVVELPKITLFRLVILTISIAWLLKWIEKNNLNLKQQSRGFCSLISWLRSSPLNFPVVAFLLVNAISTLISVDIRISLVGIYKFYFWGFLSLIGYSLLYFITVDNFSENRMGVLIEGLLIGSFPVAIYGICQRLGLEFLDWAGGPSRMRIWSTLGNSNFLGGYLIMIIPLALCLIVSTRYHSNNRTLLSKSLLVVLIGLLGSCLVYTLSRGAWLGLLACLPVWGFFIGKDSIRRNRKWLTLALVACVLFPILLGPKWKIEAPVFKSGQEEMESVIGRAISITNLGEPSISARIEGWKSSLRMFKKRPLLGWGLDNFGTIYPQYITPKFVRSAGRDMLQSYAHNEFLQVGTTMGIIGLITYVWLIVAFLKLLIHLLKKERGDTRTFLIGILSSCVSLMVYNQFHFSVVTTAIMFWLFMGVAGKMARETQEEKSDITLEGKSNESVYTSNHSPSNFIIFGIIAIMYVFLSFLILRPVVADIYAKRGRDYTGGKSWDNAISSLKKAVRLNPWVELYRINLGNAYKEKAEVTNSIREKEECIEEAIYQFKENLKLFSHNPFAYRNLGIAYMWKAQILREGTTELALKEIAKALAIFPCFISALEDMGKVYFHRDELDKTCVYLNKALEILPEDLAMRTTLGAVYFKMGNKEKALDEWKKVWEINPGYEGIKKYLVVKKGEKNE